MLRKIRQALESILGGFEGGDVPRQPPTLPSLFPASRISGEGDQYT
jgi:hypothetical protein